MKMKVLGIGEVVLDKSNIIKHYPKDGEKTQASQTSYSVGGPVPAALILLARLGVQCTLICSLGNDDTAKVIKKKLKKENIKLIINQQAKTKTNTVLVNRKTGSRTIIKDRIKHRPTKNLSSSLIRTIDLIIIDRHEPIAFQEILKKKKITTPIVIDPSTEISSKTLSMLQKAEHPIIPIESLKKYNNKLSQLDNLKQLQQIAQKTIIVTAGGLGSLSYNGKKTNFYPAYQVDVVDTLGAGDVFRGAYGFGVLNKWNEEKIINFANLVAAMQCRKTGNGTAIPYKKEIYQFMKKACTKKINLKDLNLKN
ncbi:MAG: PfkB family carbohydrate kinase [Candidatus Woesebacteria bacterium]|jgi:sugar/nucleoside kinase (ribokinase family)